jgi:hypothetical protein
VVPKSIPMAFEEGMIELCDARAGIVRGMQELVTIKT